MREPKGFTNTYFKRGAKWVPGNSFYRAAKGQSGHPVEFPSIPVDLTDVTTCYGLGDSLMAGSFATATAERFINQFCTQQGITTINNLAQGGRGLWRAHEEISDLSYTRNTTLLLVCAGLNDMKRGGFNVRTYSKVRNSIRCLINKQIISAITASGSSGVTRTGTFTQFDCRLYGGYFGTGTLPGNFGSFISAGGAGNWSRTFTLTTGQRGCSVLFSAADGVTVSGYGTCKIYIDGILVAEPNLMFQTDGINDGAEANTRIPLMVDFYGLTEGSHTIQVVSDANGFVVVDSFNVIGTVAASGPILFCEFPYCDDNGYRSATADSGTRKLSHSYSRMIYNMILEYREMGWTKIGWVNTNKWINQGPGMDVDGTHWNDLNNDLMTKAIFKAVKYPRK